MVPVVVAASALALMVAASALALASESVPGRHLNAASHQSHARPLQRGHHGHLVLGIPCLSAILQLHISHACVSVSLLALLVLALLATYASASDWTFARAA